MFMAKWRCSVCGRGFFGNGDEMIVRSAGAVNIVWGIQNHHSNVNILLPKHCKFRTENRGPQTYYFWGGGDQLAEALTILPGTI